MCTRTAFRCYGLACDSTCSTTPSCGGITPFGEPDDTRDSGRHCGPASDGAARSAVVDPASTADTTAPPRSAIRLGSRRAGSRRIAESHHAIVVAGHNPDQTASRSRHRASASAHGDDRRPVRRFTADWRSCTMKTRTVSSKPFRTAFRSRGSLAPSRSTRLFDPEGSEPPDYDELLSNPRWRGSRPRHGPPPLFSYSPRRPVEERAASPISWR